MKKGISKITVVRTLLAVASIAVIVALLPRSGRQSFNYELNQPWRYPLLTAQFDIPVLRDSVSASRLRDSIDASFIPFVRKDDKITADNIQRLRNILEFSFNTTESATLVNAVKKVLDDGIVDVKVYDQIRRKGAPLLRMKREGDEQNSVVTSNASKMLSPAKAFSKVDSLFKTMSKSGEGVNSETAEILNICLSPNVVIDSVTDSKFRNQEYLNATGAQGVIKKGQRIVDIGEIVTPQIYTNIETYQEMLNQRSDADGKLKYQLPGQILYSALVLAFLYFFMAIYRNRFYNDLSKMTFLMSLITLLDAIALTLLTNVSGGLYLIPFAAVPVLTLVFFDSRTAIFALLTSVLLVAPASSNPYVFFFVEFGAGLTATFSIHQLSRRSQLLRAAILCVIAYIVLFTALQLVIEGSLETLTWRLVILFAINGVLFSFSYVLVALIEKVFGFTSVVTLVELSDINHPLLRRLAEEAPGTFQHSMQVSMLAAEAARAVGAGTQLVRTGALYHDIGKLESPVFFTENQHGVNPHEGLDPKTSAWKIISHVTQGLTLASAEKLPKVIRSFISEHHGRGITRYFYNTAVNANPDSHIDKEDFMYPGPNPQSKETAILMMADAVEAASRSLRDYSATSINALVDKIIDGQIADGLFREAPISLRDIETVKKTFKKRLATIYHSRVEYPELKQQPV